MSKGETGHYHERNYRRLLFDDSFSEHMSLTLYPDSFAVRWSLW